MAFGRSLRIYLADGTPTGVRLAEIVNWTGQAIACPRTRVGELAGWTEAARPGVYFLLEGGVGADRGRAYIGESENVHDRLLAHLAEKDFWSEAVAFTSKDSNLTKAHVRYLEGRIIGLARDAARYTIENGTTGTATSLPRADLDAMDEFLDNLRTVLGALGHRVLEPLASHPSPPAGSVDGAAASTVLGIRLAFEALGLTATGFATDQGFLLSQGSQVAKEQQSSLPKHVVTLRSVALSDGALQDRSTHLVAAVDIPFSSSSTAASFVAGSNRSGPLSWKAGGRTLRELEIEAANRTKVATAEAIEGDTPVP